MREEIAWVDRVIQRDKELAQKHNRMNDKSFKVVLEDYKIYKKYLQSLKGRLKPYLIKIEICNDPKSKSKPGFSVDEKARKLSAGEFCYTDKPNVPDIGYYVIFTEVDIQDVASKVTYNPRW